MSKNGSNTADAAQEIQLSEYSSASMSLLFHDFKLPPQQKIIKSYQELAFHFNQNSELSRVFKVTYDSATSIETLGDSLDPEQESFVLEFLEKWIYRSKSRWNYLSTQISRELLNELLALLEGNASLTGIIFLGFLFPSFRDNHFESNGERMMDIDVVHRFLLEIRSLKVPNRDFPLRRVKRDLVNSEGERVRKLISEILKR